MALPYSARCERLSYSDAKQAATLGRQHRQCVNNFFGYQIHVCYESRILSHIQQKAMVGFPHLRRANITKRTCVG